ncbi:MAG: hypothetical protein ACYC8T_01215 [Myxococcaceae bacterium]
MPKITGAKAPAVRSGGSKGGTSKTPTRTPDTAKPAGGWVAKRTSTVRSGGGKDGPKLSPEKKGPSRGKDKAPRSPEGPAKQPSTVSTLRAGGSKGSSRGGK